MSSSPKVRRLILSDGQGEPFRRGVEQMTAQSRLWCENALTIPLPVTAGFCGLYHAVVLIWLCEQSQGEVEGVFHTSPESGSMYWAVLMADRAALELLQQLGVPDSLVAMFSNCETIIFNI